MRGQRSPTARRGAARFLIVATACLLTTGCSGIEAIGILDAALGAASSGGPVGSSAHPGSRGSGGGLDLGGGGGDIGPLGLSPDFGGGRDPSVARILAPRSASSQEQFRGRGAASEPDESSSSSAAGRGESLTAERIFSETQPTQDPSVTPVNDPGSNESGDPPSEQEPVDETNPFSFVNFEGTREPFDADFRPGMPESQEERGEPTSVSDTAVDKIA